MSISDDLLTSFSDYHRYRRQGKKWLLVFAVTGLAMMGMLGIKDRLGGRYDVLGGHDTISGYLRNNTIFLVIAAALLAGYIVFMARTLVGNKNSGIKLICVVGSLVLIIYTLTVLFLAENHILSDNKSATEYEPDEYVLSTYGGMYYLGFENNGDFVQLQIPEDVYEELSAGEPHNDADSEIYNMIINGGYENAAMYTDGVVVEYYYYSAIFESAELK